ncbi:glucokinase [Actinomadura hibisca]|uniref:glucokinase n=1 Tax=Actinomadura hibisca TaxID=68565 RepID=UPI0008306074|nr:glucokinase [Actinomadura hibisca]
MNGPWLVADVGGTNARFALIEKPGGAPARVASLPTREHAGLADAAERYLAEHAPDVRPVAACLAVAGPVAQGRFRLTNADWPADTADRVRDRLGLAHLEILNDFEALALALPALGPDDAVRVGDAAPGGPGGALAVVGPGTGLGVAGLVPTPAGWLPLPGEGGQVDIPAGTEREVEVMRLLRAERGAATAEYLLSGDGLVRTHRLLSMIHGVPAVPCTAAEIAADRTDPVRAEALRMFCALLGSFAGNVALTMGARGGVYLGGGILPRIADILRDSDFRARFEDKPPVRDYLRSIPTSLIVHPCPALAGAAARLAQSPSALEAA